MQVEILIKTFFGGLCLLYSSAQSLASICSLTSWTMDSEKSFKKFDFPSYLEVNVPVSGVHVPLGDIVVGVSSPFRRVGEVGQLLHTEAFSHRAVGERLSVNFHLRHM